MADPEDLPESAPKSLAGATFLLVQALNATVEQGFARLEVELSAKASTGEVAAVMERIVALEDLRDAQAAVRAFRGKMWKVIGSVAACAGSVAIVVSVIH